MVDEQALMALAETRTVFMVTGDQLTEVSGTRSTLDQQFRALMNGYALQESALTQAATASATAFACLVHRADTVKSLPLMVVEPNGEAADLNPIMNSMKLLSSVIWYVDASLNIYNVAYVRKWRNKAGYPTGLQWLHCDLVEKIEDAAGCRYRVQSDDGALEEIPQEDIVCFPAQSFTIKSRVEVALTPILGEQGVQKFRASFFRNMARPDGMLIAKGKKTEDEIKRAKQDWKQFQGSDNAFKTFVQGGDWEWIPITPNPVDLAIGEVSSEIAEDICKIMQVNPVLIGAATAADALSAQNTYRQIERSHIEGVALPRLDHILETLYDQWLATDFREKRYYRLEVNRKGIGVLSNANLENAQTAQAVTIGGMATYNEGREFVGLDVEEGYLSRDPVAALSVWESGIAYLDEVRRLIGLPDMPFGMGRVVKTAIGIVPLNKLVELAEQNVTAPAPAMPSFPFTLSDVETTLRSMLEAHSTQLLEQVEGRVREAIPVLPAPVPTSAPATPTRAAGRVTVGVSLANNAMLRYARRTLSAYLTEQELPNPFWETDDQWFVTFATLEGATLGDAKGILAQLEDLQLEKFNTSIARFDCVNNHIVATLANSESLYEFSAQVSERIGVNVEDWQPIIPLAIYEGELPPTIASEAYPIVLDCLEVRYNNQVVGEYELRFSPDEVAELKNWQHVVTRGKKPFLPLRLADTPTSDFVHLALRMGATPADVFPTAKRLLRGEFREEVRRDQLAQAARNPTLNPHNLLEEPEQFATPEEFEAFWSEYDKLQAEIGDAWLEGYMAKAWETIAPTVSAETNALSISFTLQTLHDDLVREWVGTADDPGAMLKLIWAGMAAGNESLIHNASADYRSALRELDLSLNWKLQSEEAIRFATQYTFSLISRIDGTTQDEVSRIVSEWLERGGTLEELTRELNTVFNDPVRARLIAQTETTRVYNEGAKERWRNVGVQRAAYQTVKDEHVCPICRPLQGREAAFDTGWVHDGRSVGGVDTSKFAGQTFNIPAHPGCRCFMRPIVEIDFSLEAA